MRHTSYSACTARSVMQAVSDGEHNRSMKKWWPFQREPKIDPEQLFREAEAALRAEIETKLANGAGRQAVLHQIEQESQVLEQRGDDPQAQARLRAYDLLYSEIRPRMFDNLTSGKNYEMAGQIDEAIACYEKAVRDQTPTRFPYEHLRVIYRRREEHEAALRVCRAALENPFLSRKDHAHFAKWAQVLQP